jgi:hypothetical protein
MWRSATCRPGTPTVAPSSELHSTRSRLAAGQSTAAGKRLFLVEFRGIGLILAPAALSPYPLLQLLPA